MGNKSGLTEKLRMCWFWLTSPTRKHVLMVVCEFCNSTNIIRCHARDTSYESNHAMYLAEYECKNCGATCECMQVWTM